MQVSPFTPSFGPPAPKSTSKTTSAATSTASPNAAGGIGTTSSVTGKLAPKGNDVVQQFMDYANMDPMERMRANILKSMGLTEDDLNHMTPEQQKAVEQKIEQIIQQELQKNAGKTGQVVNISA